MEMKNSRENKLPKVRVPFSTKEYEGMIGIIAEEKLNTVCQSADCPNIFDCFSRGTLTFMILGNICTKKCSYCKVKSGNPFPPDKNEPKRIAGVIERLKLDYVVITCVTRNDLDDGGAGVFVETVTEIKKTNSGCKIELLISDLNGNWEALKTIVDANPTLIGHNVEIVRELFPKMRPQGNYERSVELLKTLKKYDSNLITKSGIMIGLGETEAQIIRTMKDIRDTGCNIMTIGQYLSPSSNHALVKKFYSMEEFSFFKDAGESLGFDCVESGPLVRSSFNARESYEKARRKNAG